MIAKLFIRFVDNNGETVIASYFSNTLKKKILLAAILLLPVLIYLYINYFPPFNESKWKNTTGRSAIVDYIINTKMLDRKSYDEVIALLCPQDFIQGSETQKKESKDMTIVYVTEGVIWIDHERLNVEFRNDTLIKVYRHFN